MRIDISLLGPSGVRDVSVVAPADTRVSDVGEHLARACGAPAGAGLRLHDRPIESTLRLGPDGLRTGALVTVATTGHRRQMRSEGTHEIRHVGGARAGSLVAVGRGDLTIGRGPGNIVVLADDAASRDHATFEITGGGATVRDLGSTNGTWLDGAAVPRERTPVRSGQVVRVAESLLEIGEVPRQVPIAVSVDRDRALVHRPPRSAPAPPPDAIAMPELDTPPRPGRVQWLTALLPAVLGVAIAVALDSPQFLLFMLLSPVMILSGAAGDRVQWRRVHRRTGARHAERLAAVRSEVATHLAAEAVRRRIAAPDPTVVQRTARTPGTRLWERRIGDPDQLRIRVGTAARPAELQTRTGSTLTSAGIVADVPVTVDLRAGPVGVAAPRAMSAGFVRWILGQIAVLHSPAEVEIVALLGSDDGMWQWMRWLPHVRGVAEGPAACERTVAQLACELEARHPDPPHGDRQPARWTVVFADADATATPGLDDLLGDPGAGGITAVCRAERTSALPSSCTSLVIADRPGGAVTVLAPGAEATVLADQVSAGWAEETARALAPLSDPGDRPGANPPESCRLPDLLGLAAPPDAAGVEQMWQDADDGAAAPIGADGSGRVELDLVRDGPHVLVAGTTGSGKSELLRTLVAGLALRYPPDAVGFLLVDYKGGAAFGGCTDFPHTAALVTDLDPHLTRRALRSLHAELRRRERILGDVGVADLTTLRARHGRAGMPRLVIVVDEFAELAADLPDFVDGLVGVARRGRSLGVHLVLATQRPGGSVSAEIRANTSARIALRVTDAAESRDVIDAPDAAFVDPARPGRAWLRTARGLSTFQTARSTGTERPPAVPIVVPLGRWRMLDLDGGPGRVPDDDTELAVLATNFGHVVARNGLAPARAPWAPPLPTALPLVDVAQPEQPHASAVGLVDLPDDQAQPAVGFDLANDRSVLIAGRSGSGRTGAATTLVLAAAGRSGPADLEVYGIDAAGDLGAVIEHLPHVATCLGPGRLDLVPTLLQRLSARLGDRVPAQDTGPRVLLVVDGWDRVLAGLDDVTAAHCAELLQRMMRAGAGSRATIVVTGGPALLAHRLGGAAFEQRFLLACADHSDYSLAGIPARDVPADLPPGRAVRAPDAAAIQFAHAGAAPDRASAAAAARAIAARWPSAARDTAIRLRPLPTRIRRDEVLPREDRGRAEPGTDLRLGVMGDAAGPCVVDLVAHRVTMLVAGPPRSGRTSALLTVLAEAERCGIDVVVACSTRSPLHTAARSAQHHVIVPGDAPTALPGGAILLVDDAEDFVDGVASDRLVAGLRDPDGFGAAVVAGRSDELATTFRGVAAEIRRQRCGVLLAPGRLDGDLLGVAVSLPARSDGSPPGRGLIVGDPRWGEPFAGPEPLPIQLALP